MAYDALTSTGINNLVAAFNSNEQKKFITPLTNRKTEYQNLVSAWSTVSAKLTPLITSLNSLKATGSSSIFSPAYSASSSNTSFVAVSSSGQPDLSAYSMRVNQLAKYDNVVSESKTSGTAVTTLAGTHTFNITSGDYTANVDLTLGAGETNLTVMQKIRDAINSNTSAKVQSSSFNSTGTIEPYADVQSGYFNAADTISSIITEGTHSFDINLNGTTTTVTLDNSGWNGSTTYNDLLDQMVSAINSTVSGVTASKVTDLSGKIKLDIQANNSTDFLKINSDNSNALLTTLGVSSTGKFDINLNGTTTTISLDKSGWNGATTYSDVLDQMASAINSQVSGVTASKLSDSGNVRLNIQTKNSSDYLSINSDSSNAWLNSLGISANKVKAASSLVSASVFNPTSTTSKLSFAAKNSGYGNRLEISSDSALTQIGLTSDILTNRYNNTSNGTTVDSSKAGFLYSTNWFDGSTAHTTETSDNNLLNSKITFNGISIQRDTNTISDVVNGLTFALNSVMQSTDADVGISVSKNSSNVRSQIDSFISNFNSVYVAVDSKMYVDVTLGRGIFQGDPSATSLINSLRSLATSSVKGLASGTLSSLSQIGITYSKDNGLTVSDSNKLNDAIANNLSQVEAIFNSDNGVATKLYNTISKYEGNDGSVYHTINSYNNSIDSISKSITAKQASIDKNAAVLRKQYTVLQIQLVDLLNMQNTLISVGLLSSSDTTSSTTSS